MRSWFTFRGINMDINNLMEPNDNESDKLSNKPNSIADYTSEGVIHFIESEFIKNRMRELSWDVEKAELNAKIAYLNNLYQKDKNIIRDLISRIKMLENSIKSMKKENPNLFDLGQEVEEDDDYDNSKWKSGQEILRGYLDEIGLDSTLIDFRDSNVRFELGLKYSLMPKNDDQTEQKLQNTNHEENLTSPIPQNIPTPTEEVKETEKNEHSLISPVKTETTHIKFSVSAKNLGHVLPVRAVSFHPKLPLMVTASDDHSVKLWLVNPSVPKNEESKIMAPAITFYGSRSPVISVIFTENGDGVVAGNLEGKVLFWFLPNSFSELIPGRQISQHDEAVWCLASLGDSIVSLSSDGVVYVGGNKNEKYILESAVTMSLTKCEKLVFGFSNGVVQFRDFHSFSLLFELNLGCGVLKVVCNSLMSAALLKDGTVRFLKVSDGSLIGRVETGMVGLVDLGPCLCVTGGVGCVRVWNGEDCVFEDSTDVLFCGESVTCVASHKCRNVFAVGMADGSILLYS